MDTRAWMAVVLGLVALVDDLRRRTISNWISGAAVAAALACHAWQHGTEGIAAAAGGALLGFAVFLVFFCLGGMGCADVKLMAPFGALLGPAGILMAAVLAAAVGGFRTLGTVLLNGRRRALPYTPAIVLGAWLALLGVG